MKGPVPRGIWGSPEQILVLFDGPGQRLGRDQVGHVPHLEEALLGVVDHIAGGNEVPLPLPLWLEDRPSGMFTRTVENPGDEVGAI